MPSLLPLEPSCDSDRATVRGSVDREHNVFGTPLLPAHARRERAARQRSKHAPVMLNAAQRQVARAAIVAVRAHRQWSLHELNVRSNHVHGVRRTREDKRLAVDLLLEDKTWRKSSNEELARLAGVSPGLVGNRRKHMERTLHNAECSTRKTADGREMRVGNIGRKRTESAAPACAISNDAEDPATHAVETDTLETPSSG